MIYHHFFLLPFFLYYFLSENVCNSSLSCILPVFLSKQKPALIRTLGIYIMVIGLLSIVLHFLNMNFIFLNWIDRWGTQTGWMIRGGITLFGIVLYLIGRTKR